MSSTGQILDNTIDLILTPRLSLEQVCDKVVIQMQSCLVLAGSSVHGKWPFVSSHTDKRLVALRPRLWALLADVPVKTIGIPHMWDRKFTWDDESDESVTRQLGWEDRLTRSIWDASGTSEQDLLLIVRELQDEELLVSRSI